MRIPVIWPTSKNRGIFLSILLMLPFVPVFLAFSISFSPLVLLLDMALRWFW